MATELMSTYFLYSALLALKLLAMVPLSAIVCNREKVQRANLSDLKNLTPFWLVSALYVTTGPDRATAVTLIRIFVMSRFVAALGHVYKLPQMVIEAAFFASFLITTFMGGSVVYHYRDAI